MKHNRAICESIINCRQLIVIFDINNISVTSASFFELPVYILLVIIFLLIVFLQLARV